MSKSPTRKPWLLIGLCLFLAGCPAAAILIPPLIQFGASLLDSAVNNYDEKHEQNMQTLLTALQHRTNPYMAQGMTANPSRQTGGYQQTGYPNQDNQTAQGYPPSQGYPSSPDYSQQPYDPYQTQQPQYVETAPSPNNPYPNQEQQQNPYSNNPVYPDQPASASGFPPAQQPYDPYQNSQSQYEENTAYPNNPDPNQYPQGNPYANDPNIPQQQSPPSGYPPYAQNPYPQQESQGYPSQPMQPQYPQQGEPYAGTYGHEGPASDPSTQNPYGGTPGYQTGPMDREQAMSIPISLDVLLVKKHLVNGVSSYLPINDGETLFDGRGNPQAGDKFRVMFRANTNCYVYVIAVDGSAWAQGIFPSAASPFANPVKAGQQYLLPEGKNWFSLDQFKGVETIFFVASHERRPDIENILATISGRERHPAEQPLAVSEPAIIPNGYSGARLGTDPFAFNTSQTTQQELLPTTYFVKTAGEDLRITRWFRHQ